MRCFTVREDVIRGITVQKDGEQPAVILGTGGEQSVLPLDREMADYFIRATEVLGTSELPILHAQLRGNPPYLCRAAGRDPHALVLVQVPVPDGGSLWMEGTGFTELDDGARSVKREQHPFPPPGVIPVDASGGDLLLLMTKRGASFRICRSGDLQGAPPVLIVTWSGGKLRVVVPRKYQQSSAA